MAKPTDLTADNFDQTVLKNSDKPVLVDFWAVWCVPCQMLEPILDEVSKEVGDSVVFTRLNVDDHSSISERYTVMSIPTVMIFYKGEILKQFIGVQDKETYVEAIKEVLAKK